MDAVQATVWSPTCCRQSILTGGVTGPAEEQADGPILVRGAESVHSDM